MIFKVYVNYGASYMNAIYGVGYMSAYCGTDKNKYNSTIKEYLGYGGRIEETKMYNFAATTCITFKGLQHNA